MHSQNWQPELCMMLPQGFEALHDLICGPSAQGSHKVELVIHVIFHLISTKQLKQHVQQNFVPRILTSCLTSHGQNIGKSACDVPMSETASELAAARATEAAYHFWVWAHVLRLDSRNQPGSGHKPP